MTNITLFDAAQAVREAVNQIDQENRRIVESYAKSRELFQTRPPHVWPTPRKKPQRSPAPKPCSRTCMAAKEAREKRLERLEA